MVRGTNVGLLKALGSDEDELCGEAGVAIGETGVVFAGEGVFFLGEGVSAGAVAGSFAL